MSNKLTKSEQTCLALQLLYESYGYRKFAMRKFEEYSLYLENKNFLTSEYILTFNDPGGKLMALKPDVTLSILKNAKNIDGVEKTYYRENVYRLDKRSMQYREIEQIGLEVIDASGAVIESEICELAAKSLEEVDSDYILCISNMEFVSCIIDDILKVSEDEKTKIVSFIKAKNAHELYESLIHNGCDVSYAESFSDLVMFTGSNDEVLAMAKKLAINERMKKSLESLERIVSVFDAPDKIRIDFTLMNDSAYYNGLVFCGYVKRIPKALLTGGFYDKMAQKFGNKSGGAGFALSVGEINAYYEEKPEYDVDVLLVYNSDSDSRYVLTKAKELRESGLSVRIETKVPQRLCCREIIYL